MEDKLLDLIDGQTNPTIATYAKTAEVHIRITARAADYEEGKALVATCDPGKSSPGLGMRFTPQMKKPVWKWQLPRF